MLHSVVAGAILYAWSRRLRVPSGRSRRWLLALLLIVPLVTALVPGRGGFDFRNGPAWFDSVRVLALPLAGGLHVYHLVLALAGVATLASLWQELGPVLRRPRPEATDVPAWLVRRVRGLPAWARCEVGLTADQTIFVATDGRPWRPRLVVSRGALAELDADELEAVLRHEHAHWQHGRWLVPRLLFLLRLAQCYNPVALLAFRTYSIEVEIACDAEAVAGRDPKTLARGLVKVYEATDPGDVAARSTLRRRVDVLLGRIERSDTRLAPEAVVVAAAVLALLLPWIV